MPDTPDENKEALKAQAAEAKKILPGLKKPDPDEKKSTAKQLAGLGVGAGPVAALDLTAMALRDKDPEVRQVAAVALSNLGQVNRIVDALKGTRGGRLEKQRAAEALVAMKEAKGAVAAVALSAVRDPDSDVRNTCRGVLSNLDGAELESAMNTFRRALQDVQVTVRRAAIDAFADIGKNAEETAKGALREALQDRDWIVRKSAAEALATHFGGDQSSIAPAIAGCLKDTDWLVRQKAAESLGVIGAQSTPALKEAFKSDTWLLPQTAARVLGSVRGAKVDDIPMLTGALHNPSRVMRWRGALALAALGQDAHSAADALTMTLQDSDWTVRTTSRRALFEAGADENPVKSLSESLIHKDWDSRERAARGLQALGRKARTVGGEELEGSIHKHLRDPVRQVRWGTWRAMNTMRPNTRTPLPALNQTL